ncbi:GGDEF domain-containing protein [Clostridium sp.]|uniref:GGDEF domain-containing protein n=1 Tax=Clostridium sp. TaxID=1506 RepID=UPI003D6CDAE0
MSDELREIISGNNLRSVFQPIVSLQTGDVIGYEALTRGPVDSKYINPEILFEEAKIHDLLWDLEILCRSNAIKRFSSHNSDKLLFVNVDPDILKDEHFIKGFTKEILTEHNINPLALVLEITEKTSIDNYKNFNEVINYYKSQGYKIAIDDVGTGYSGLTTIANTRPSYIKMDMSLITNVTRDNFKKAIIKAFVEFANTTNIKVIAEGIEDVCDLNTLIEIGVHYGQGFLINRPNANLLETPELIKNIIIDKNISLKNHSFSSSSKVKIGEIARRGSAVLEDTTCSEIDSLFKSNSNITGVPIINSDSITVGLVMNSNFFARVGTQFGWSIYMKRSVHIIMDSNPLIVDYYTPLDKISKIVISREEDKQYDYIIVEKDNKYYGVVTVISLLEKIMEFEVNVAKYSNPLTGLPGNVVIEDSICKLIVEKKEFSLLYFDINDFKAFNDTYGFENGDRILSFTASVIQKHTSLYKDSFVGHVGGDDFVAIIPGYNAYKLCQDIINEFDSNISNFYNEEDKKKGYIQSFNRNNNEENYPIMSISIAIVMDKNKSYTNIYELTEDAAKIKKKCKLESKRIVKSCFIA